MKSPKGKPTGAKLRNWRVDIIRQRAHHLGTIDAPNAKAAEAVKLFDLTEEQRKRLSIWEWRWS
jgi:hypothetical protein